MADDGEPYPLPLRIRTVGDGQTRQMLLCFANGNPLPSQRAVTISQKDGEAPTLTITFVVNGRSIVLGDG